MRKAEVDHAWVATHNGTDYCEDRNYALLEGRSFISSGTEQCSAWVASNSLLQDTNGHAGEVVYDLLPTPLEPRMPVKGS